MPRGPIPRGLVARLDAKIDRSAGPGACWPFLGALSRGSRRESAYGSIREGPVGSPTWRVNRLVLLLEEVPEEAFLDEADLLRWLRMANRFRADLEAAHACDNSRCCNPGHLAWAEHGKQVSEQAERRARARDQARQAAQAQEAAA